MKKAVEQETLQTLVETGATREFRVLREGEACAWNCASAASGYRCGQGANRCGCGAH
jgi:hypothetical protein